MSFRYINAKLRDQGIRDPELRKRKAGKRELADAQHSDPELRDAHDTTAELPDSDDAARHNRRSIRPVLERDVHQRQPGDRQSGLIFIAPSVPRLARRIGRPALRTRERLFGDFVPTLATDLEAHAGDWQRNSAHAKHREPERDTKRFRW